MSTFTCLGLFISSAQADMYQHNLQVFTANTMEVPCKTAPKELFFGEYEKVVEMTQKEMKDIVNSGISQLGSNVGEWFTANGISGSDFAAQAGIGIVGTMMGLAVRKAIYSAMDDPEYLLISECNSGKDYTRLITMVVSDEKLDLATAKQYAKQDQDKVARR